MADTNYFSKVASASGAPLNTLLGQWSGWRSSLGMVQLLGSHIGKIESQILASEGDQVVHPQSTIPFDIRPSDWLNPRLYPDLQAEQIRLVQQFKEAHAEEREEGRLAEECAGHADGCRTLADSFKSHREQMNQSLPRPGPSMRSATQPQNSNLNSLLKAMATGDGLIDTTTQQQIRQQQQQLLIQQYQQMNPAKANIPTTSSTGTAVPSHAISTSAHSQGTSSAAHPSSQAVYQAPLGGKSEISYTGSSAMQGVSMASAATHTAGVPKHASMIGAPKATSATQRVQSAYSAIPNATAPSNAEYAPQPSIHGHQTSQPSRNVHFGSMAPQNSMPANRPQMPTSTTGYVPGAMPGQRQPQGNMPQGYGSTGPGTGYRPPNQ